MSSDPLTNRATAEIKAMLVAKYRCSEYSSTARERIREILTIVSIHAMEIRSQSNLYKDKIGSQSNLTLTSLYCRKDLETKQRVGAKQNGGSNSQY